MSDTNWRYEIEIDLYGERFESQGSLSEHAAKDIVRHFNLPETVGEVVEIWKTAPQRRDTPVPADELLGIDEE